MKRFAAVLAFSSLLCLVPTSVRASDCQNALSFVVLSSGECQIMSNEQPVAVRPTKQTPFFINRLRLRPNGNYLSLMGEITNQSDKVYRLGVLSVQIGGSRVEEVFIGGLISPGQKRKFDISIERSGTRYTAPVAFEDLSYSER